MVKIFCAIFVSVLVLGLFSEGFASDELGENCTPGQTKTIANGCNFCTCHRTGKWACIDGNLDRCLNKPHLTPFGRSRREEGCIRGQIKTISCNTCRCSNNGFWSCTRKACPEHIPGENNGPKAQPFYPKN